MASSKCVGRCCQLQDRSENCRSFVRCMLATCLEIILLPSLFLVRKQVCSRSLQSDTSLRRFDILFFIANDCRPHCHVGNTGQHCTFGLFQDSDLAYDFDDSTSGGILLFSKSNNCYQCSDMQEPESSLAQFYGIRVHLVGCWITYGRVSFGS